MKQRKNYSPEFKAKVALEASHGEMTLAELFKKYDVHPPQIDTWKRVAIEIWPAFVPHQRLPPNLGRRDPKIFRETIREIGSRPKSRRQGDIENGKAAVLQ